MQGDILRLQSIRIFLGGQILTVKSKNYRRGFSVKTFHFLIPKTLTLQLWVVILPAPNWTYHIASRDQKILIEFISSFTLWRPWWILSTLPPHNFQTLSSDLKYFILGSPNRERHHSAGSQSLTKINQINMEPEFTQTTKKIKHQKSSSFSTLKRAKKEWKKLFK